MVGVTSLRQEEKRWSLLVSCEQTKSEKSTPLFLKSINIEILPYLWTQKETQSRLSKSQQLLRTVDFNVKVLVSLKGKSSEDVVDL